MEFLRFGNMSDTLSALQSCYQLRAKAMYAHHIEVTEVADQLAKCYARNIGNLPSPERCDAKGWRQDMLLARAENFEEKFEKCHNFLHLFLKCCCHTSTCIDEA